MKKVLVLAYYYPPLGGGGVQRTVKFVKYLPNYGYTPIVVGGIGVDSCAISYDNTLSREVEPVISHMVEANVWEHFLRLVRRLSGKRLSKVVPRLSLSWWECAVQRVCKAVIKNQQPDVIYATTSPYQTARVAATISKKHKIPWILDMRDPWALDPINYYPSWLHYKLDLRAMRQACHAANAVILNTPRSLEAVKNRFTELSSDKLFCITNGWDCDDINRNIDNPTTRCTSTKLTVVHTGRFQTQYATKVEPAIRKLLYGDCNIFPNILRFSFGRPDLLARTPYYLFKSIRKLLDDRLINESDVSLVFVGAATTEDKILVRKYDLENIVEFTGYLSHDESVRSLFSSDVLFLPLHKPKNSQFPLTVPGKTYEYFAARKAILALVPPGDARDFVVNSGLGIVCDPTNVGEIAQVFLDLIRKHQNSGIKAKPNDEFIQRFERKNLTKELTAVFDFVLSRHS